MLVSTETETTTRDRRTRQSVQKAQGNDERTTYEANVVERGREVHCTSRTTS